MSANVISESALDVADCVMLVRRGDEDAARRLLDHLYPQVLKLVRAYLPRRTSDEDLAQTVFMKVFAKLDQYSGKLPLEHWVSRIAINTCLNELAAETVRPEVRRADLSEAQCEFLDNLPADVETVGPSESIAAREIVDKLLAALPPRDRLLIKLLHLDGYTPREVQTLTGWNGTLIRSRAFRARRRLKKHFHSLMRDTYETA